ncbi:MAG TPA: phosphoadenylyl-sulfate reductase [Candidatus Limnocylindrales bacterium]|nr:phosphoadenylyl-sulfate reductase [Candidatus Limnocylindrales bacterium]
MTITSAPGTATHLARPASMPLRGIRVPADIEAADARGVLVAAIDAIGAERLPLVTSLAPEGIVILDMLLRLVPRPRVVTLDTGLLPADTHALIERVQAHFDVEIDVFTPDQADIDPMVRDRGRDLYYRSREDRLRCCDVRKVLPMRRALADADGWITGLRRDQASTRAATPKMGRDVANGLLWKVAPLADWTSERVWEYVREHDLPYNSLHDEGYASIGCAPCTRAIAPGEDERAGRWWWESPDDPRECGLHMPAKAG